MPEFIRGGGAKGKILPYTYKSPGVVQNRGGGSCSQLASLVEKKNPPTRSTLLLTGLEKGIGKVKRYIIFPGEGENNTGLRFIYLSIYLSLSPIL
jgi:hypothetical protein